MQTYIVRQPILCDDGDVLGYEILYQDDESLSQSDTAAANAIEDFLQQLDGEKFLSGKIAFLTFTPNLLLKNIPKMFANNKLVIQIEDNSVIHPLAQKVIYRYKKQGYRIALKGFEFAARYFDIMDVIDIIKVDFSNPNNTSIKNIIDIGRSFSKDMMAYNVSTPEAYEQAKSFGCKYMQGPFVAQGSTSKVHRMDHMQGNFFQLIVAVTKDEPDVDEITNIISRDVTLAFSLIKLVNSAYFALRNQVKSVKQALVVLGLGQLKQWVYLLSFKKDTGQLPDELIRISFLRANFCQELIPYAKDMPISKSEAYLLGMFSTIGVLMDIPMEIALADLAVCEEIKQALLYGEGACGSLYKLILCYEKADWSGMTEYAGEIGIPTNIVSQKYFECIEYVNDIWHDLTVPYNNDDNTENEEVNNSTLPMSMK